MARIGLPGFLMRDLKYALRGLRARPGFTTAVVLTLALGIGANAAIFSVVDRLLFRPPPLLSEPALTHRVNLAATYRGEENISEGVQFARYLDLTRWTKTFSLTSEYTARELAIGVGQAAREMRVGIVSASFFDFFDAQPVLGRYFTPAEDSIPAGSPVVVLSNAMWQSSYGGRSEALGEEIQIGPKTYTVIGVAPPEFVGLWPNTPPVAYIPITSYASWNFPELESESWWTTYRWTWASMIAQRKPGVSKAAADADLTNALLRSYAAEDEFYDQKRELDERKPRAIAAPILRERGPNQSSSAKVAALVAGMALLVLLIACANVANLLLARALQRRREIAVRLALGVTRGRLLSQLLTESLLLALLGGAAGLLVAQWGGSALRAAFLPDGATAPVLSDLRTLIFVGVAILAAGLLTGLAPVWQAGRVRLALDLKAGAREGTVHRSRARVALLVMQGALSVLLLVGAGLFVRSLHNVKNLRLGYDLDPVLVVNLNMRGVELDSAGAVELRDRLLRTAREMHEVEHAALNLTLPFYSSWSVSFTVPGVDSIREQFNLNAVSPDYFATMGTRILRGRGIDEQDAAGAPGAIVVSTSMANTLWPGDDALGKCVKIGPDTSPCRYVVGVAEDIKNNQLSDDPGRYYYLSSEQFNPEQASLLIRTRTDASLSAETIRKRLQREMPGASYVTTVPFEQIVGPAMRSWELGATMFVVFGFLALTLATIGLYGVISYSVAQRSHEMGVRIALGARSPDLIWLVVRQGLVLAAIGILIGGVVALASAGWLEPLLFDVSARDPLVYTAVLLSMLLVALAASFIPARRASRVQPGVALRSE